MWHHERGKIVHWLTSCFFTRGSSVNAIRNSCMQHKKPETKPAIGPSGSIYQSQVLCCLLLINTKTQCKKNWRVELALAAIDCTVFGFPTEMLHIWKLLLVTLTKHFAQQNIHTDIEQTHQGTPRSTASAAGEEEEKERKKEGVAPLVICKI